MDKPGRRIHAALKQNYRCEGSPKGQRDRGGLFLVTSFGQTKEVTRQQAKKGLPKPEETTTKFQNAMHSHAEHGNDKKPNDGLRSAPPILRN